MTIITIYGKFGCSACETAKRLMTRKELPYNYIDMNDLNNDATAALLADAASAGVRSLPIIVVNGKISTLQEVL